MDAAESHSRAGRASVAVRQADERSEGTAKRREDRPNGGTASPRQPPIPQPARNKSPSAPNNDSVNKTYLNSEIPANSGLSPPLTSSERCQAANSAAIVSSSSTR